MKPVDPEVLAHMSRVEHGEGLDFGLVEKVNNDDDETAVLHLTQRDAFFLIAAIDRIPVGVPHREVILGKLSDACYEAAKNFERA